jgi:hypothetical protein
VSIGDTQRQRIEQATEWAAKIRTTLGPILETHGDRVHFRPGSQGVAMVGLLPDRPQRGQSNIRDLPALARDFETRFNAQCRDVSHGRETPEKALQSFLISNAYRNGRRMVALDEASTGTGDPAELVFVTDELPLPTGDRTLVCDILALRRHGGRTTPVLMELKSKRMLKELVAQVECYSTLMDEHAGSFARLFEAVLGEPVRFDGPTEKWIVWPTAGATRDPREDELTVKDIRVVGYAEEPGGYSFRVGASPRGRSAPDGA